MSTSAREFVEFDQYAPSYRELLDDPLRNLFTRDPLHFHRRKWLLIQRLLRLAGVKSETKRWLDVGCGRGELLEMAGSSFAEALGCDLSPGMLPCSSRFEVRPQPSPIVLPFADGSVDFVTSVCVYHHVHGAARALLTNEIKRVLTPGGMCCLIEHNPWNPVTRAIVKRCPVDVDAELLIARSAGKLFKAAGFEPLGLDYFLYLPEPVYGWAGSVEAAFRKVPLGGQYALLARTIP